MKIPKRDDKCYREIEKFEEYELTNCIAYEMVIRTKIYQYHHRKLTDLVSAVVKRFKAMHPYDMSQDSDGKIYYKREYNSEDAKTIHGQQQLIEKEVVYAHHEIGLNMLNELDEDLFKYFLTIPTEDGELWEVTTTDISAEDRNFLNNISSNSDMVFSHPTVRFPNRETIQIDLNIQMSDTALLEYVNRAREQARKPHTIPDNTEINKYYIQLKSVLGIEASKKGKDTYPKKPKTQKLADWFYIYDIYKIRRAKQMIKHTLKVDWFNLAENKRETAHDYYHIKRQTPKNEYPLFIYEIDKELCEYHKLNYANETKYSFYTYENIMGTMKLYIDQEKYKILIKKK